MDGSWVAAVFIVLIALFAADLWIIPWLHERRIQKQADEYFAELSKWRTALEDHMKDNPKWEEAKKAKLAKIAMARVIYDGVEGNRQEFIEKAMAIPLTRAGAHTYYNFIRNERLKFECFKPPKQED